MNQESNRIEYKSKVTSEIEKSVVAFLNSNEGGILFVGIDDDGTFLGVNELDDVQLQLKNRLRDNISPSCLGLFDILIEEKNEYKYIKILIASGPEKPYFLRKHGMSPKGVYMRIGSSSEQMPQEYIDKLYSRRVRNSLGRIVSYKQDLTFTQLKIYYDSIGFELNENFAKNLNLLTPQLEFNYIAYMLSDVNNLSIKVAKYRGKDRVDLIENNEYGYESLIKSTNQVLDKLTLENVTRTKITPKERENQYLWNPVALREAVINAFVHNDYTREVTPKFEIFSNRIEISSAGGLPQGLSKREFFQGFSVPRNQELMRVYKDLNFVEQLGSGIRRVLKTYKQDSFYFSENFLRVTFPSSIITEQVAEQVTEQVTEQVKNLLELMDESGLYTMQEIIELLGLRHRPTVKYNYIDPALELGLIEMTIPDKPRSSKQKYRLTKVGKTHK